MFVVAIACFFLSARGCSRGPMAVVATRRPPDRRRAIKLRRAFLAARGEEEGTAGNAYVAAPRVRSPCCFCFHASAMPVTVDLSRSPASDGLDIARDEIPRGLSARRWSSSRRRVAAPKGVPPSRIEPKSFHEFRASLT